MSDPYSNQGAQVATLRAWFYERPRRLAQGQLAGSDGLLYTAPAASVTGAQPHTEITELILCNTDTSARTVTINLVALGGSSSAANQIYSACSLAANSTLIVPLDTIIEAGGMIRGLASAADKVTYTISGVERLTLRTT